MFKSEVFYAAYFVIFALCYFVTMYLEFPFTIPVIIVMGVILIALTIYARFKQWLSWNPVTVGIVLFVPLMIVAMLVSV